MASKGGKCLPTSIILILSVPGPGYERTFVDEVVFVSSLDIYISAYFNNGDK